MANEVSIKLPAELAERVCALAKEEKRSVSQLIQESLHRYVAFDRLDCAISSGADREDALEVLFEEYVDRMVHEARTERRAEAREKLEGERKAS